MGHAIDTPGEELPPAAFVTRLFQNYWIASAILAAANLGVADEVGDSPRDVQTIAGNLGVNADCLSRLLRGLASVGIFREDPVGHFLHTPRSSALRRGAPGQACATIRMFGLKATREAMAEYEHAIRTGESAFQRVHGASLFEVLASRPDEAAIYHAGMAAARPVVAAIADVIDFSAVRRLVDVGGGRGTLLATLLKKNPAQRGVLFDLPAVVEGAASVLEEHGVSSRCDVVGGDMRVLVPAGGDGYLLRYVLHGWRDDDCIELLRRIHEAGEPGARVFVIESVMPPGNDFSPSKPFDLFLLLGGDRGRVRTQAQHRRLLAEAGFELSRVVPVQGDECVIEARRRD